MAYRRRKYNGRSTNRSRTSLNRRINRAITTRSETKILPTSGVFIENRTDGVNINLPQMPQGPEATQRIGNRIRNVRLTGCLSCKETGPVRVVIYCPKVAIQSLSATNRFNAIDTADNWILHDKVYFLGPIANGSYSININKKLNHYTTWGGSNQLDWKKNPVKVYLVMENNSGTSGKVEGHFKLFYKDE